MYIDIHSYIYLKSIRRYQSLKLKQFVYIIYLKQREKLIKLTVKA